MKVTFDMTSDQVDDIVRQDLEGSALQMLEEGNDKFEFIGNKAQLFAAFCTVLEYYSKPSEWELFIKKTEGKKVE